MSAFVPCTPVFLSTHQQSSANCLRRTTLYPAASGTKRSLYVSRRNVQMTMDMDMDTNIEEEPRPAVVEDAKLFVGNLSWDTTSESLKQAFSKYGTVADARVVTDRYTGRSRGFGFIQYEDASSAEDALIGMNGVEVDGRNVRVDRANRSPRRRSSNYY